MPRQTSILLILFLWSLIAGANNDPELVSAALKSATVYRNGAELTHGASTVLNAGNNDLTIEGISSSIDINSMQINCPSAVTILGMSFSSKESIPVAATAKINGLKDSVAKLNRDLDKIMVQQTTISDLLEVLKANRDIKGSQTGLSVAELIKLMDYYKRKSAELQNELAALKNKEQESKNLLRDVSEQIANDQNKSIHHFGALHLQLSVSVTGKYDFLLTYITPDAYWTPSYDIRVPGIASPLKISYKARIVQTTGTDWKQVKLSLSTSSPGAWGTAPLLKSWFLAYINPVSIMDRNLMQNKLQSFSTQSQLNEIVVTGFAKRGEKPKDQESDELPLYVVNGAVMSAPEFAKINAAAIKTTELLKADAATAIYGSRATAGVMLVTLKEGLDEYVSVAEKGLDVTFDIDLPYDIPSGNKEQTATLREYEVKANYKYYAVPRLDKDAYLLAEIPDWEKLNLLPGEANMIVEGTYAGKSFIDPNSILDTLNLTLGRDRRVVIKKEKVTDYSSVKFLGNNKLQKFTYEITVKNNKKDSLQLLLKDQYPISSLKEIEVDLSDDGGADINTETGVLTWKLTVAPGESKKIRFAYSVKYPKGRLLNLN